MLGISACRDKYVFLERIMKIRLILPLLLAVAAAVTGCNTMEGAGKDIERGGEKIQQQAR